MLYVAGGAYRTCSPRDMYVLLARLEICTSNSIVVCFMLQAVPIVLARLYEDRTA